MHHDGAAEGRQRGIEGRTAQVKFAVIFGEADEVRKLRTSVYNVGMAHSKTVDGGDLAGSTVIQCQLIEVMYKHSKSRESACHSAAW